MSWRVKDVRQSRGHYGRVVFFFDIESNGFVVKNFRIRKVYENRYEVQNPGNWGNDGEWHDNVYPVSDEAKQIVNDSVGYVMQHCKAELAEFNRRKSGQKKEGVQLGDHLGSLDEDFKARIWALKAYYLGKEIKLGKDMEGSVSYIESKINNADAPKSEDTFAINLFLSLTLAEVFRENESLSLKYRTDAGRFGGLMEKSGGNNFFPYYMKIVDATTKKKNTSNFNKLKSFVIDEPADAIFDCLDLCVEALPEAVSNFLFDTPLTETI